MLKNSATQTIGNTPLLCMKRLKNSLGLKSDIFAKLEFLNPAGSIKDRVAEEIIASAIREGKINAKSAFRRSFQDIYIYFLGDKYCQSAVPVTRNDVSEVPVAYIVPDTPGMFFST